MPIPLTGKMLFDVRHSVKFFLGQRVIPPDIRTKRFKVHFLVLPRRYPGISREIPAAARWAKNARFAGIFGLIYLLGCLMFFNQRTRALLQNAFLSLSGLSGQSRSIDFIDVLDSRFRGNDTCGVFRDSPTRQALCLYEYNYA